MLYQVFIYPIQIIIEMAYFLFSKIVENPALCIIGVSLTVQILTLPLYNIAEKWQKIERDTQKKLKAKIDKIKSAFKGDEQYMILSEYYRQQGYHPIFAMRSTLGLLIQIPFFIAAYTFLSHLQVLDGQSFYFIQNLASPDALFSLGRFKINLLPIIMTILNVLSGVVYSKGFSFREKIQLYAMAGLFLVLLYASPAGLVLYWTMNNVFSLVKNLICKTKKPLRLFYMLCAGTSILVLLGITFFLDLSTARKLLVYMAAIIILSIPLLLKIARRFTKLVDLDSFLSQRRYIFALSCIGLFLLSGLFIPSALTASSPQEFSFIAEYSSPLEILQFPLLQTLGVFLIWLPMIYILFSRTVKSFLTWLVTSFFLLALLNTLVLRGFYGTITNTLQFDSNISIIPNTLLLLIDFALLVVVLAFVAILIVKSKTRLCILVNIFACITLLGLGISNVITTQSEYTIYAKRLEATTGSLKNETSTINKIYSLSKTEPNVLIFMVDMAVGKIFQTILDEKPDLVEQYRGFTYYPNTVTVGQNTILSSPALYGGYDYLPNKMNNNANIPLVQKHNEALTVLPLLFKENDYLSTITDAPWANYSTISDNSIFSEHGIRSDNIEGKYTSLWLQENTEMYESNKILEERLVAFSFFRMLPRAFRGGLYMNGRWWSTSFKSPQFESLIDYYSALDYLAELTDFNANQSSFSFIYNFLPHYSAFLQYPEYIPAEVPTTVGKNIWGNEQAHKYYHTYVATIQLLAEYFAIMKEKKVFDNTRIIIVSDHGQTFSNKALFEQFYDSNGQEILNLSRVNALLLVKDFNSSEPLKIDSNLMTNADVPYLATVDIINNAKNPFTNTPFTAQEKENGVTVYSGGSRPDDHNDNTFNFSEVWQVKDNIFDPNNWTRVE